MKKPDLVRILAVLIICLAIIYFYLNLFAPRLIPSFLKIGIIRKPYNILIVGTDVTYSAETKMPLPELKGRADTILLAHVDPIKGRVNILSIPRDTYTLIPEYGIKKINAANAFGGMPLLKETVQILTQRDIDYYIEIKPTAITKMVDLLGGISLFVEKDMQYTDKAQGLDINLKKGWQKLSGKQAHDYIRFRHDIQGDIGRVDRQQKFMKALTKSIAKPSNIIRSPFVLQTALEEIETNLPTTTTIRLLNFSRMLSMNNIYTATASGEPKYIQGVGSVWMPDKPILEATIREYF